MSGRSRAARTAVLLAIRLLPAGTARDRYRREHLGELHQLTRPGQLAYAAGVVSQAWALRRACTERTAKETTMTVDHPGFTAPLHCRLHLFHRYRFTSTDDGRRYRRCRDCGQDDPHCGGGPFDPIGLGVTGIH